MYQPTYTFWCQLYSDGQSRMSNRIVRRSRTKLVNSLWVVSHIQSTPFVLWLTAGRLPSETGWVRFENTDWVDIWCAWCVGDSILCIYCCKEEWYYHFICRSAYQTTIYQSPGLNGFVARFFGEEYRHSGYITSSEAMSDIRIQIQIVNGRWRNRGMLRSHAETSTSWSAFRKWC
jgi:hypothetical protein